MIIEGHVINKISVRFIVWYGNSVVFNGIGLILQTSLNVFDAEWTDKLKTLNDIRNE